MDKKRGVCRICMQEDGKDDLICPCLCKGSIGSVHPVCIENWLKFKGIRACEMCHYRFNVKSVYPPISIILYQLLKSLWYRKRKAMRIIILLIFTKLLHNKLILLRTFMKSLTADKKRNWIQTFSTGIIFGVCYSELAYFLIKETIRITRDVIQIVRETGYIVVQNY